MRRCLVGSTLAVALSAAAGCAHAPPAAPVPAAPPDEIAAECASLDAPAVVVTSREQLALLSEDNPGRRQPEFELARAYYCLGLYSEALAVYDVNAPHPATAERVGRQIDQAIAQAGGVPGAPIVDARPLRLLLALHRRFPGWRGIDDAVAACAPASYDAPALADARGELLVMAGWSAYRAGEFARAGDLFGRVPAGSPAYVKAKLLEGAIHVRKYDVKPVVAAFKEALRASLAGVGPDQPRFRDLANISLARTFYSSGQFDLAAQYYGAIPRASVYWRERLFEMAWTNFRRGDPAAALRDITALQAEGGSVAPDKFAETLLLESAAAGDAGDDARAAAAAASFTATTPPLFNDLKAFLAANPDDGALYARMAAFRGGKSDLPPAIEGVARRLLGEPWLARQFDGVDELRSELARYERLPPALQATEATDPLSASLTARLSTAIKEAGLACRRRMTRVMEELAQLIKSTISIPFEFLRAGLSARCPTSGSTQGVLRWDGCSGSGLCWLVPSCSRKASRFSRTSPPSSAPPWETTRSPPASGASCSRTASCGASPSRSRPRTAS